MDNNDFQTALALFRKSIDAIYVLPDNDFEQLTKVMRYKKYAKGEVVLAEGKVCKRVWFVMKGSFRIFSVEDGQELNVRFFLEHSLAADFISLRHQIPSSFYMVALEDTEALHSYRTEYRPVLNFSKSLIMLTAEFFALHFFEEIEQSNSFKLMTPEERYKNLLIKKPAYLQRIPLTYLASYLGISRKTLTRIRSNTN